MNLNMKWRGGGLRKFKFLLDIILLLLGAPVFHITSCLSNLCIFIEIHHTILFLVTLFNIDKTQQ